MKPVLDGEPLYEDHPLAFRAPRQRLLLRRARAPARVLGRVLRRLRPHLRQPLRLADVRARAGKPINGPLLLLVRSDPPARRGADAVRAGAASNRGRTSRASRILSIVVESRSTAPTGSRRRAATATLSSTARRGGPFTVNMGKISGEKVKAWWYNPRTGTSRELALMRTPARASSSARRRASAAIGCWCWTTPHATSPRRAARRGGIEQRQVARCAVTGFRSRAQNRVKAGRRPRCGSAGRGTSCPSMTTFSTAWSLSKPDMTLNGSDPSTTFRFVTRMFRITPRNLARSARSWPGRAEPRPRRRPDPSAASDPPRSPDGRVRTARRPRRNR